MSEPRGTELPMEKPKESMSTAVLTQIVPAWVHVGDIADLLQDDARVMGAVQREQRGGPVTVGQEANLGWRGTQSLGRMTEQGWGAQSLGWGKRSHGAWVHD